MAFANLFWYILVSLVVYLFFAKVVLAETSVSKKFGKDIDINIPAAVVAVVVLAVMMVVSSWCDHIIKTISTSNF